MGTTGNIVAAIRPVAFLLVTVFLYNAGVLVLNPFLPSILLQGLCPGKNECREVILLVGALQLGAGIGAVLIAPVLGGISDDYGRKPVLLLIVFSSILPTVVLAYSRTRIEIYVWFPLAMIFSIVREGGLVPVILASVADIVDEDHRSSAVGWSLGILSVGFFVGTSSALVFKIVDQALWAAAILLVATIIFLKLFVKESNPRQPLLPANESQPESALKLLPKAELKAKTINLWETSKAVCRSRRLMIIALVDFLNYYGITGMGTFVMNEIAAIYMVTGATAALGQASVYPVHAHLLGDCGVLWVGIVAAAAHYLLYGLAWTLWVPYIAAAIELFHSINKPALGTMASRGVDRHQQGKIQGFMGSVRSAASMLVPLTVTPLIAASLGDNPPFGMMGFPFVVFGSAMVVALLVSIRLPRLLPNELSVEPTEYNHATSPPEDSTP